MHLLLNVAAFKIGWLSSVVGGAQQLPWLGPAVVLLAIGLHLFYAKRPRSEFTLILICGLVGAAFDSVLVANGLVTYPSGLFNEILAPVWIIGMWMLFATTLNVSMQWLKSRPALAALIGLFAGPLSYLGGHKLGGIEFVNETVALAALAIGWAIMMPLLMTLAGRFDGIRETA
jgi:hypothetical protein